MLYRWLIKNRITLRSIFSVFNHSSPFIERKLFNLIISYTMASKEDNDESDWMDTVWKKAKLADDPEELKVYQTTWLLRASNRFHESK